VDFKELYGGNSEKTRKKYADEQLEPLINEIRELKLLKDDDRRWIDYYRNKMRVFGEEL
jgi:hypothetical protein